MMVACAVVITLETRKCRKKAPHFVENFSFLTNRPRKNGFRRIKKKSRLMATKNASGFLNFAPRLSCDLSKFSNNFKLFLQL